jgi:hypothetical protein
MSADAVRLHGLREFFVSATSEPAASWARGYVVWKRNTSSETNSNAASETNSNAASETNSHAASETNTAMRLPRPQQQYAAYSETNTGQRGEGRRVFKLSDQNSTGRLI